MEAGIDLSEALTCARIPAIVLQLLPGSKAGDVAALLPNAVLLKRTYGAVGARARGDWDAYIAPRFAEKPATSPVAVGLTPRETDVLCRVAAGDTNFQIAGTLTVSTRTVEHHIASIYAKLGVHNRVEAANWARDHGI
jgi:DNA-binding NarL/FixJ family response regulator